MKKQTRTDEFDNILGTEKCEHCEKKITKKMKTNQQVIYASAEHTLSEGDMDFCDLMFGGVYCCKDCYYEQSGHKVMYKKGGEEMKKEILEEIEKFKDNIDFYEDLKQKIKEL